METRTMSKVVRRVPLREQPADFAYWQTQTYQARLAALEQIRQEFHRWPHDAEPRLQRLYQVVKR